MPTIIHPSPLESTGSNPPAHLGGRLSPNKKWWLAAAGVLLGGVLAYELRAKPTQPAAQASLKTVKVGTGSLERALRISGSTAARNFSSILAPLMRGPDSGRNLVLIKLAPPGSIIRKGDRMAEIDAQPIKDHLDDLDATVAQAEGDIKKRRAEQAIEMETLRQSVREAKAALEKAKLDNNAAEVRMPIDKELLQLGVQEAEAQSKELQNELITMEERQRAEIRILEYTRDRHTRHRDRHRRDLTRFSMQAPIGGLVVMESIWRSGDFGQIQEGDQIWPGEPFMKIVDTKSMEMSGNINQTESELVHIGQPARVNFDAFPDLHLEGKVRSVGALGVGGWRENYYIRTIPVVISIQGRDSRVIPDLSASADIVLSRRDNVLLVPRESVDLQEGKHTVYVKRGSSFMAREVRVGQGNDTQIEILAGLKPGDEIALGRPTSHP